MITEFILKAIIDIFIAIFSILPNIPNISSELYSSIIEFFDMIFENGSALLSFFVRPSTLKTAFSIVLAVYIFEYSYKVFMWIIKKLPIDVN